MCFVSENGDKDLFSKKITLNNKDCENEIKTEMSNCVFIFIISFIVENSECDIDDGKHEETVIKVENFLEIEPCLSAFLY